MWSFDVVLLAPVGEHVASLEVRREIVFVEAFVPQPCTREPIPAWDVVLARKLLIEADEQAFLATAKLWPWPSIYP